MGKKIKKILPIFVVCAVAVVAVFVIYPNFFQPETIAVEATQSTANRDGGKQPSDNTDTNISPIEEEPDMADQSYELYEETNSYFKIVNGLQSLTPGTDYIENEVIMASDSKREAKNVADLLNGELQSFSDGIAVITVPLKVYDLMLALAEANETAITVSPNYIHGLL